MVLACCALQGSAVAAGADDAEAAKGPETRPNILLIITDQQYAGVMSCAGDRYVKTPAMDSLAAAGARFEMAYAANPVCVPSRVSMMTGRMPSEFGMRSNAEARNAFPPEALPATMGRVMRAAGYETFYGGKTHMCPELHPPTAGYGQFEKNSREVLPDAASNFIRQKRKKPFFAVASFINPHDICYVHRAKLGIKKNLPGCNELYQQAVELPDRELPPLPENYAIPPAEPEAIEASMSRRSVTPAITMREEYTERDWRIYRWLYCRYTEQVDRHIGRFLATLRETGQEDETLILFTSDHGNMDAAHRLASKNLFYEESAGVPFIMQYAGTIPAGQINGDTLVNAGLDILPTLCDYAGATPHERALGTSLRAVAEGGKATASRPYVVAENSSGRMVRSARYKYCIYATGDVRESLVDLESDPGEMTNLARQREHQATLRQHRRYLAEWIRESNDQPAEAFAIDW